MVDVETTRSSNPDIFWATVKRLGPRPTSYFSMYNVDTTTSELPTTKEDLLHTLLLSP